MGAGIFGLADLLTEGTILVVGQLAIFDHHRRTAQVVVKDLCLLRLPALTPNHLADGSAVMPDVVGGLVRLVGVIHLFG